MPLVAEQVGDGAPHVADRACGVELHGELARIVGLARPPAVVEVRRERDEALAREAIGDVPDVRHEAPPLLDDDDAGALAAARRGEVAVGGAVAAEGHPLTHGTGDDFTAPCGASVAR